MRIALALASLAWAKLPGGPASVEAPIVFDPS
jgi:hypothetical protein